MRCLSFSFINGFRAPPAQSYAEEPDTGVEFPEDVTKVELREEKLVCYSGDELLVTIEKAEGNKEFSFEMEMGERVVSASVHVTEDKLYAQSVQFLIYDEA